MEKSTGLESPPGDEQNSDKNAVSEVYVGGAGFRVTYTSCCVKFVLEEN